MVYHVAAGSFLNTIPLIDWFEETGDDRVALSRAQLPVVRNNLQRC
jgi:hypothetical protein